MSANALVGAAALGGAGLCVWWSLGGERGARRTAVANLRSGLVSGRELGDRDRVASAQPRSLVERITTFARHVMPSRSMETLNRRITKAGKSSTWRVEQTLAVKVVLGGLGAIFGVLLLTSGNPIGEFYGIVLAPLGFFGPDLLLRAKAKERSKRIRIMLPDTLDQITVCVEAGLGFEAALARAAKTGEGPLADELVRTLQDVQLGVPRKDAIRGLADRNDVDELRQFVLAILQAEGLGVPIARVLRIHATELREKRRQEAQERAMKISIKMLFPLVTCILPTTFIVMLGPVIFNLVDTLGGGPPR